MAEQEEDFSSLPLPDRFTHKVCQEEKIRALNQQLNFNRTGKYEKRATKMLQRLSRKPLTNQIQPSNLS